MPVVTPTGNAQVARSERASYLGLHLGIVHDHCVSPFQLAFGIFKELLRSVAAGDADSLS